MSENLNIRSMEYNDLDAVLDLEQKCFDIPWTRGMFEDELLIPMPYILWLKTGEKSGYAGMWKIIDEGHVTNLAVHPDHRGKGFGKS